MLTAVVRDKGSEAAQQAPNLYQQLQDMEREGMLHPSLVEWAAEIRLVGNAGAHFDELAPVDQTEATALARLCRHLLTVVYETPARIRRARQPQPST
jgi:predicted lysophospholipase L1 biosynthesis ABC-type transport system permease subunit